jgi:hypothetical protein
MPDWMRVEINFHQQDELSIYQESTLSGSYEELYEIFCFINYGIRQMSNLGACQATNGLASTLVAALSAIEEIAAGVPFGGLKFVPYPGNPGRKRFVANLEDRGRGAKFDLKMIGFGLFARGFGYYAPMSTLFSAHLATTFSEYPVGCLVSDRRPWVCPTSAGPSAASGQVPS